MKKMKQLWKENVWVKVIFIVLISEVMVLSIDGFLELIGVSYGVSNLGYMIREIVHKGIPYTILAIVFGTIGTLKHPMKGFIGSLLSGAWILIVAALGVCVTANTQFQAGGHLKGIPEIICYALLMLMVGYSEELLMRGTVTKLLIDRYGTKGKGMWISILGGSVIFGLWHVGNILYGQSVDATLQQVVATIMLGFILNAVYVKRGNLYGVMLLHAVLDFGVDCQFGIFEGMSISNMYAMETKTSFRQVIISQGTYVIAGLVILFTKWLKERKEEKRLLKMAA